MVKETSTLDATRPTVLDEKRRIERELGLPVEPDVVVPRGNNPKAGMPSPWRRFVLWIRGPAPPAQ